MAVLVSEDHGSTFLFLMTGLKQVSETKSIDKMPSHCVTGTLVLAKSSHSAPATVKCSDTAETRHDESQNVSPRTVISRRPARHG